jgi:hypothetical protein
MALSKEIEKINYLYTNPDWVDIPAFFKYIKTSTRGEIYRLVGLIVKQIDDNWLITYKRNSNKNYNNYIKYLYSIGYTKKVIRSLELVRDITSGGKFKAGCSQHRLPRAQAEDIVESGFGRDITSEQRLPRAQALDDIITFPSRVNDAVLGINNLIPVFNDAAIGITQVTNTVTSMIQFVNDIFNHWKNTCSNVMTTISTHMCMLIEYFIKILALAHLLTQPHNQNLTNAVALLTLILPSNITAGILPFAEGLIRVIKGMMGAHAQGEDDECGFVKSFFQLTLGIAKGLFGDVPKDVFDSLNISSRKVKLIADYIKGTSTIIECLTKIFYKALEWIGDGVFKHFGYAPMFLKEETLTPMIDEFLQIKLDRLDQQCTIHVDAARKVVNLYERLIQYESKMNRSLKSGVAVSFKQAPYLRIMIKTLESCINRIPDHLRTGLTPRRVKPFWIYLYGDPRIGKTAVLQPHLVTALSKALKLINKYEDYTNYTYLRNCGEDYWEGYDNHPVLWYNDLFQNYAQEEKMHQAIMELTNIVDDNVYPLEMAFERKHCVYFSSEVVISNAQHDIINAGFIQNKCWSGGQHLFARRNVCLHLSLNPYYAATIGIDYVKMRQQMIDNPKDCVGYENCVLHTKEEYDAKLLFPNDMYIMTFTDPSQGHVITILDYPKGIDYVCQQAIEYKASQSAFKDKLYNHFEGMWAQAGDDVEFYDVRLATQTELAEAILQQAINELGATMPQFVGSDDLRGAVFSRMDNGTFSYNLQMFSENRDDPHRASARINLCVELLGAEYYMRQNMTWWRRFAMSAKKWVGELWFHFKNLVTTGFEMLGPYAPIVRFAIGWYALYKVFDKYVEYVNVLCQPLMVQPNIEAQSNEAKLKPKVAQILRVPKQTGVVAQSYDQQNTIVENIINKQMCKFTIRVYKDGVEVHNRRFGSGICLGSDVFVAPYHFWYRWFEMKDYWNECGCDVKLCLNWNEILEVVLDWNSLQLCRLQYQHTEDLAYFRIKHLVQRPHIKKFFINSNDRPSLTTLYMYGKRASSFELTTMGVTNGVYKLATYMHDSKEDPLYGGKFSKREICIPIALHYYNCCTSAGDCGVAVMHCDSALNCKKIIAMHTAGHVVDGYGIGSLIFQEDIDEVFKFFYPEGFSIAPQAMEYDEIDDSLNLSDLGLQVMGKLPRVIEPMYNVDRAPVLMMPRKSRIAQSIVYDIMEEDFGKSTVKPAHLRPYTKDDIKISPLYNALKKMAVVSPMPDCHLAEHISQHIFETIASWPSSIQPRVFNDDEMINGYNLMNAVEMSTSAGYPYVILDNTSGKHPFFTKYCESPIRYTAGIYLQKQLDQREADAGKGIITQTYFIDTLKDETRPITKVDEGKTRLFQISPLDFNLLLRKYFGAFLCHTQEVFIVGEGAVGVNANSYEWTLMLRDLLEIGNDFINGDGKNFDACAGQPMAMYNVNAINKWYQLGDDWQPVHDRIRCTLWATFLNSNHIVRNLVYRAQQGNKSGIAVTTWFNNLTGMFAIRLTYILSGYQLHDFHKSVKPKFYGDDDLIAVNKARAPKVTCSQHKITMSLLGIEYTSATKDEVVETWYSVEQISFLKRRFVWDGIRYLPQLDHTVIYEIARWSESDPTVMLDQINRFNSSLLEVSNYGRKEFNQLRDRYVEYCFLICKRGLVIDPTQLFCFDYCEFIKWGDLYKPAQLSIDRSQSSDVERLVLYESAANDVKLSNSNDNDGFNSFENLQTANAQTHEGKSLPPKVQTIRIARPKAQGEEVEVNDFNMYLVMMDYLKEMEPCFKNFERAMARSLRQPVAKWTISQLYIKVQALMTIYRECVNILSSQPEAQGEEGHIAKVQSMVFENSNFKKIESDEAVKEVVKEETTYVVNSQTPHQPPVIHNTVPRPDNSNLFTNMEMYFKRPTVLDQFSWATTDTIWTQKGVWDLPKNYVTLPGIKEKLAMVQYARPDFEFEILVNATHFHYGRLVFAVMPFYQTSASVSVAACYDSAYNVFTWPHWYQVSAGTGQSVKFVVPYRHVWSQIQIGNNAEYNRYMFSIKCYVSAPLQTTASATGVSAPVEVTILCRMINPRLYGNNFLLAQGEEVSLTKAHCIVQNPISGTSTKVVSSALDGVSKITRDLSQLAYAAGFSTPVNLGSTNSMQIRQPLLNKMNDLPNSVVLGSDMQAQTTATPEFVNSESQDDMNINQIISSPALLNTVKFASTDAIGKILFNVHLSPDNMSFGGEGYTAPLGAGYPLPVAYLSQYFNYWRGGWKIHLSAISSAFHSARLRLFYTPAGAANSTTLPGATLAGLRESSYLRNVIWDIAKTSDITLRIPYEALTHWRVTDTGQNQSISGTFGIQVMNTLTSATPNANATPIYIQVFVSCDDDFQFALPGRVNATRWAPDIKGSAPKPPATAQSEEVEACAIPSSSSTCIREQVGILMGDIDARHRKYRDNVSVNITSLKQLVNQLTPIDLFSSKTTDTTNIIGRAYTPYSNAWIRNYDDQFWYAPIHTITPLFRFQRGGFRVHVMVNDKVQATAWMSTPTAVADAYTTANTCLMNGTSTELAALYNGIMGMAFFFDNSVYPIDVTVPYFKSNPCIVTGGGVPFPPVVNIGLSTQKTAKNMIFCVSGADDYMLGYRMSIPSVRTGPSVAARSGRDLPVLPLTPDTTKGEHLTMTKDGLKIRRNKRSFLERLMEAPNTTVTDSEDDEAIE